MSSSQGIVKALATEPADGSDRRGRAEHTLACRHSAVDQNIHHHRDLIREEECSLDFLHPPKILRRTRTKLIPSNKFFIFLFAISAICQSVGAFSLKTNSELDSLSSHLASNEPNLSQDISTKLGTISDNIIAREASISKTITTSATVSADETTPSSFELDTSSETQDDSGIRYHDDDAPDCSYLSADDTTKTKNLTNNERLVLFQGCLKKKTKDALAGSSRVGMEMFEKLTLGGGCSSSLMRLMNGLAETKSFAVKFFDASAKIPSGVMYGLLSDFGDFDECLSIRSNPDIRLEDEAEENSFSGKYCLMNIRLNYHADLSNDLTSPDGIEPDGFLWDDMVRNYWTSNSSKGFQIGMCFPSRCSKGDLDELYRFMSEKYNFNGSITSCQDGLDLKAQHQPDLLQTIIMHTFSALILLTILATLLDRYCSELAINEQRSESTNKIHLSYLHSFSLILEILACFSLRRNWRIFTRKDREQSQWGGLISSSYSSVTGRHLSDSVTEQSAFRDSTLKHIDSRSSCTISESDNDLTVNDKLREKIVLPVDMCLEQKQNRFFNHLSGLRLFIIIWITLGQSFLYPSENNYQYYRSIIKMNITRDSVWFATTNFTLGIDMLLYVSGLTFVCKLAHLGAQTYNSESKLEVSCQDTMRLIIRKILRFWPTYLTVIAIAIVMPLLSDGPMWPEMVNKKLGATCRHNWWANLLFINNFFNEPEICLPSSWFVSVLMQLFLIGALIIVIARRYSMVLAMCFLTFLLFVSSAISFAFAYFYKVRAPVIRMDESFILEQDESIFKIYTSIFNNLGPFLFGMIGGFVLVKEKMHVKYKPTETVARFQHYLYRLLLAVVVSIVAWLVLSSVFHTEYTLYWASIYWSLHRVGWAFVTGYMIHNCTTGRWQLLNDILSLDAFIPLSKLIFIAYLVYPMYIHLHIGLVRDGLHVSLFNMINIYTTRFASTDGWGRQLKFTRFKQQGKSIPCWLHRKLCVFKISRFIMQI